MGELTIRRNREINLARYQGTGRAEKKSGTGQVQKQPAVRTAATVSETLRQLMSRVNRAEQHLREGRRTLQSGEAALAEVQDNLGRMEELSRQAAGEGAMDRAAMQSELELLRDQVEQNAQEGAQAGLFQDGGDEAMDALVDAVMEGLAARQDGVEGLPAWLLKGISEDGPSLEELRAALDTGEWITSARVLAALSKYPLDSPTGGYLAALYLGSVIAGGGRATTMDPDSAAMGLQLLLEMVADGMTPDEAVSMLTNGAFSGLEDFEAQFLSGTAPGLDVMLMELLFSGGDSLPEQSLLALMGGGGGEMELLMDLLAMLGGGAEMGLLDALDASAAQAQTEGRGENPQTQIQEFETVQASGEDLSQVNYSPEVNELTTNGGSAVILRGLAEGQEAPALNLAGEGTVTLQQVDSPLLTVQAGQTHVTVAGENELAQVQLKAGTTLTLDGSGLVRIGLLRGGEGSVLRLTGGGLVISAAEAEALGLSVVVDGPTVLLAAENVTVRNAQGQELSPFDIVWKTLLPEWTAVNSLAVNGQQGQLAMLKNDQFDPLRMWLFKGNQEQGWPAHTIALRGRDRAGRPSTQYIYVRWDEKKGGFQPVSMYPNPFTVTGGEQDVDWTYDEESHTLYILTGEVTGVSGGSGMDANAVPFSGRIALVNSIGRVSLTLDGVDCRVSEGRAFDLARGNDVTLLLARGTENTFESGPGYAGISMGDGTRLCIDQAKGDRSLPDGVLNATGGTGGAGIGRDSGAGQEPTGTILIRGGVITAAGTGGGAGIGGALGARAGDIRLQGGVVTALASCSAAAIGAGIQGACGDIAISGSARVAKAQGGGPDGDIGGCLFGNCGKVQVSAGTDIGDAKLWTRQGLNLQMGETTVTLPRFRISARALRLDGLDLSTREAAHEALSILAADRRWVDRLQGAYGAMYGQLGQSMYSANQHIRVVRDNSEASSLLMDMREVLRQSPLATFLRQRGMVDVNSLLR